MNIYNYIMEKEYQKTPDILLAERKKLYSKAVKNHKTNQQIQKLQEFLQDKFYGKEGNSQEAVQFYQEVLQMYGEQNNQIIMGHDWGSSNVKAINENTEYISSKTGELEHKAQIYKKTLETRRKQLQDYYEKAKDIKSLEKFTNEVQIALNEINKILAETLKNQVQIRFKEGSQMFKTIQYIDSIYAEFLRQTKITPFDYGEVLEYGMAILDAKLNQKIEKISYDTIKENLGKKQVQREGTDLSVVFDSNNSKWGDNIEEIKDSSIKIGGLQIKTNFANKTSAKADVILNVPNFEDGLFKISLKNWAEFYSSGARYGFGETSIIGAVARAKPSKSVLEHYLYALGPKEANQNQINAMHQYSKLCLAVDIISGYSMRNEGREADTIVINDRSRRLIIVYSTKQLIDSIYNNNNNILVFDGYNEEEIRGFSKDYLNMLTRWNTRHSNLYKGAVINMLNTFRVRIKLNQF